MAIKLGINGFGRIGRNVLRAAVQNFKNDIEIVAINDLLEPDYLAYMLQYDSVHGRFKGEVTVEGNTLIVNGKKIRLTQERDPANLKWNEVGADVVLESTGLFLTKETAQKHIDAGARKVILSAPSKDDTPMFVYGVNDKKYAGEAIVSNASCTTNCLAPLVKVIDQSIGINRGLMTTIHSYTGDQRILDNNHRDLRRARAAAVNMVPTSTGAAQAVALVYPAVKGKFTGIAMRVPTPNVSAVDLVFESTRASSVDEIKSILKAAADGPMSKIIKYGDLPLVSSDYAGTNQSTIFDADLTLAMGDNFFKIVAWYDNEWGYSQRVVDLAEVVARNWK